MPATAASRYCSGLSESSFSVVSVPSGRLPTMSVKVPPRSIQNCQRRARRRFMARSPIARKPPSRARTSVVMSCTGKPVAARTASAYGGMLVHSSTIAATSGWRATRRSAAATVARAASSTSSSVRSSSTVARNRRVEREPFERRVGARADRAQMLGGERRGIGGDDADAAAVAPAGLELGDEQQARRPHRHRERGRHLALEEGEEAAARRDRGDAFALERARRVDEGREQRRVALDDDAPRRRAAHGAIADRERERLPDCRCRRGGRGKRVSSITTPRLALTSEVAARAAWS